MGTAYMPIISTHADELQDRSQSWGVYAKPDDYLDSFGHFVREQINQSAALAVVVNRPKDLTREQLARSAPAARRARLLRSQPERGLAQPRATRTSPPASSAYIRQAALGEALLPFEQRVAKAMQKIYAQHPWTPVQRKWLDRLAKQLTHEVVIDPRLRQQRLCAATAAPSSSTRCLAASWTGCWPSLASQACGPRRLQHDPLLASSFRMPQISDQRPYPNDIVQKLWNLCDVLRDDGINYSDYVTELVLLLFIKMEHENTEQRPPGRPQAARLTRAGPTLSRHERPEPAQPLPRHAAQA